MVHPTNSHGLAHRRNGSKPRASTQIGSVSVGAVAKAVVAAARRASTAAETAVAWILLWRDVSREIKRLSALPDATLKGMGLERNQVALTAYQSALARWERQWGRAAEARE
jgi:hypothetical protein